jgi:serine/threonine protein phosphatase PrpC
MQMRLNEPSEQNLSLPDHHDPPLSGKWRIGFSIGVLLIGILLYQSCPPSIWPVIAHVLLKENPPSARFFPLLLLSLMIVVSWLLLLFIAWQVILPERTRLHRESEEQHIASTPLSSQTASSPPAQQSWLGSKVPQETEEFDAWKSTVVPWQTQTFSSFWKTADSYPDTHQDFAKPWTRQQEVGQEQPSLWYNEKETYQETAHVSASSLMYQDVSSQQDLQSTESEVEEQQKIQRKHVAATRIEQTGLSPSHLVKEPHQASTDSLSQLRLHQDSSCGNASPISFCVSTMNSIRTNPDGMFINGWSLCHPGIQRRQEYLEDYLLVADGLRMQVTPQTPFTLFILADGNVVSSEGAIAGLEVSLSCLTAHKFSENVLPALHSSNSLEPQTVFHLLTEGMQKTNSHLYQQYQHRQTSQMVTMTAILILGTEAYTANVGDNRAYFYRLKRNRQATDEGLFQITNDHSPVSTQLEQGTLTPEDLFHRPKVDHVYRALGQQATLSNVDVFSMTLMAGDFLVLCSDGLWKTVREATFLHIVERLLQPPIASPALLCPALVQAALEAGGYDHASIMLAQPLLP